MYPDQKDEVVQLYLDDIIPNRFQPREVFDEKALKELAVSIKEHGVIQPIIVRNVNGKYEIIAGERRYKASALAGLTKIPAIVRDLDDKESSKVALLENLQRKNLNPIEEARTYQKILEIDEMTQEELAKTMGKSQSAVANKLRLLSLSDAVQDALLKEEISERHARALLNIEDPKKQKEMLKRVIDEKMSVRVLEEELKGASPKEDKEEEEKEETPVVATTDAFVNSTPLMPTTDLPEDTSNYGKVTIAPPEEDGDSTEGGEPKFINYGEIKKEEDEEPTNDLPPAVTTIDVDKVKEESKDVKLVQENSGDLDSLLNFANPTSSKPAQEFITPAEKIVKTDEGEDLKGLGNDYFSMPEEFSPVEFTTLANETQEEKKENISVEEAKEKIRNLIEELKSKGIQITNAEMDFDKSYQVIIKIDKENKVD